MARSGAGVVAMTALCVLMLVPSVAGAASQDPSGDVPEYRMGEDSRPVHGTGSSTDGPVLDPGTYTDTLTAGDKKYYRVKLDAKSNAFVSTVLAPPPEVKVGLMDGIRVSLESPDGTECSSGDLVVFASNTARPIAGYGTRRIQANGPCQSAGEYLYTVERVGSANSDSQAWPIELKYMSEPGLKADAVAPEAPTKWSSQAPVPPKSAAKPVTGGTGFNDAAPVGDGAWKDEVRPGESRFYKVPVGWGQQLFVDAEMANAGTGQQPFVVDGVRMELYNTARGLADSVQTQYSGKPSALELGTAPVAFSNRFAAKPEAVSALRFSGWYYVQLTLDRQVAQSVPMTLSVSVEGDEQSGPEYDGDAVKAGFGISDADKEAVRGGDESLAMRTIGFTGIGIGTFLLLSLGMWTLVAHRRAATARTTPWRVPGSG
ncbi:hypothetical protein [Streptomyces sp. V1I1]|uniref:hypothetical protein n=1 Tax=Streptomyces sp. V1I1 TaxID=3042272 RepID=UPI00277D2952|nr:hypothetical protein [Streptomyces sp. V1I1]MDQ0941068.1 hypothetical protein [Streptomyces sp. V1I1]